MVRTYSNITNYALGRTRGHNNTNLITLMHITAWQHNSSIVSTYHCTSLTSLQQCSFKELHQLLPKTALLSPGQQLPGNEIEFHLPFFRSTEISEASALMMHRCVPLTGVYHSQVCTTHRCVPLWACPSTNHNTEQQRPLLCCCWTMNMFGHSLIASVYGHAVCTMTHSMHMYEYALFLCTHKAPLPLWLSVVEHTQAQ